MTLPEKFAARVLSELGPEEGAALCAALDTEPPVSVRLNPAKCAGAAEPGAVQDGTGAAPGGYGSPQGSSGTDVPAPLPVLQNADGRVPWCADGYYLAVRPQFTFDSDFHAGAYYVQEASSQFVGRLMGGEGVAGKRILDLCAAPGGKITLYASLAGPGGLVVANEIDRRRAQVLADNVRKWGTGNVAVTTCEPRQLGDFEAWFDMVAVDAPCSGEGMFRKDAQARAEWSEGNVKLCAARQDGILREAWRALKPGGRLIYSTCTFNRDEDEGALERMLAWAGDEVAEAEDMAVDGAWGIVCGRVGAFRTYRFYPHRARGEGFFAAVACKAYDAGGRCRTPKARRTVFAQVDKASAAELRRWVRTPERMCFAAVGDTCYGYYVAQAEAVKALGEALPVIYAGVAMGQLFKGSLRPDPALAFFCGLNREAVPAAELDEAQALCYLRRQEVAAGAFSEGVNLVCARGRALGFAKRIGNRVNNMYPNTLDMAEKLFYSMGEVAEMFDVNASLIRHWESQFSVIRPKRNKKGNRLFSPQDVENLKLIYHLVKERGMTLEGAKKALKQKPAAEGGVQRDAELMERLQRIRALLVEVREDLKAGQGELLADGDAEVPAAEAGAAVPRRKAKPVVKIVPEDAAAQGAAEPGQPASKRPRKPRRKKEEPEHKELFAFYEQSLF